MFLSSILCCPIIWIRCFPHFNSRITILDYRLSRHCIKKLLFTWEMKTRIGWGTPCPDGVASQNIWLIDHLANVMLNQMEWQKRFVGLNEQLTVFIVLVFEWGKMCEPVGLIMYRIFFLLFSFTSGERRSISKVVSKKLPKAKRNLYLFLRFVKHELCESLCSCLYIFMIEVIKTFNHLRYHECI